MPEVTRREFLLGAALPAAAAVVLDPAWLFGSATSDHTAVTAPGRAGRGRRGLGGPFASVEYGDGDSSPLVRWSRFGEDLTLELWPAGVVMDVPSLAETPASIALHDVEQGRGHEDVVRFFGAPTLSQLRTEVSYRAVTGA